MKKIKVIFFVIIISTLIGCNSPPPRETQGLEYTSLRELTNTSDRILKLRKLEKEITFNVDEMQYVSLQFIVLEKFKGSSSINDKIFVTFKKETLNNLFIKDINSKNVYQSFIEDEYIFFLMGRSRKNTFPKELGGSLWHKNGNPSIFRIEKEKIKIISSKESLVELNEEFLEILEMSEIKFSNLVKSLNE